MLSPEINYDGKIKKVVTVHTFYRLLYFAPLGLKMFACFVAQGVALG